MTICGSLDDGERYLRSTEGREFSNVAKEKRKRRSWRRNKSEMREVNASASKENEEERG